MNRRFLRTWAILLACLTAATGCQPSRPFYFFEKGSLHHYRDVATEIEFPDVESHSLAEVEGALPPLTVANPDAYEIWELKLEDAIGYALKNGKVMRSIGGQVFAPTGLVLTGAPNSSQTVYNPALVETDPRFGTEAALSAFDAQFTSSVFWERNERPVNLAFPGFISRELNQDTGVFQAAISKTTATGGQAIVRNNVNYEWNNNPSNLFPSFWESNIEAEFRHPLLQGAGATFNRIAGPNGTPGLNNGVAIARINSDIALVDFEAAVRNFTSDVEVAYWELYFAYRNLNAVLAGRDAALATWSKIKALFDQGVIGGEAEKEAQAREQYYLFRAQAEEAQSNLFAVEGRLRFMMGLATSDGYLIRPADEPTAAEVHFDWHEVHCEALSRSAELRRQKWQIKQAELELIAAKNYLLPRLDAVGRYRWRGFGDDLAKANPSAMPLDNAFQTLSEGDYQEWQLGLQLTVPIGFRQQLANIRNAQLNLARERALLQDQELEVSGLMAQRLREVARYYYTSLSNYNRRVAAEQQVKAVEAQYDLGTVTLDLLLDAQRRRSDAESAYFRSLVDYMLAIKDVHLRKGSLLEYNGVYLAEGPWPGKAYLDAHRHARARGASHPLNYGFTHPKVFSRGPFPQFGPDYHHEADAVPQDVQWEDVPAPRPLPVEELPLGSRAARTGGAFQGFEDFGRASTSQGSSTRSGPWGALR